MTFKDDLMQCKCGNRFFTVRLDGRGVVIVCSYCTEQSFITKDVIDSVV